MNRIPEPDLMDSIEQAEAYAETDFSEPHDAFVEYFRSRFPRFSEKNVLDLGCGTADVIARFARTYPGAFITGIDGAQAMLDIGSRVIKSKGLSHRVKLQRCLLSDAGLPEIKYDAVISNSLLHHLNDPLIIWKTIQQCAGIGAPIFVMDLLRPDSIEKARAFVERYTADASLTLQEDFFNSLLAAYKVEEIQQQLKAANLDYLSIETVSDRHVAVWGLKL
jgi:ubiquinone/menaquinone biosynthesis C-methylase UbiE